MTDAVDPTERTRTYSWVDPMPTALAARATNGLEFLGRIVSGELPQPPIAYTLGFDLVEVGEGRAVFAVTPEEWHYNPIGVVHGGLAATVLDSALGCAIHTMLPVGSGYTTVELSVNMVRPVSSTTGHLRAVAHVIHVGGRVATSEARLLDDNDKLYAHANATCLILQSVP